jgi:hypothetical protein
VRRVGGLGGCLEFAAIGILIRFDRLSWPLPFHDHDINYAAVDVFESERRSRRQRRRNHAPSRPLPGVHACGGHVSENSSGITHLPRIAPRLPSPARHDQLGRALAGRSGFFTLIIGAVPYRPPLGAHLNFYRRSPHLFAFGLAGNPQAPRE